MKIILATPVYPPEIGGPATYTVELARRLGAQHDVVVVAYADDAQASPRGRLVAVSKKQPLLVRLAKYFFVLLREARRADIMYVQNAVAAGLPALVAGRLRGVPVVLKFVGDEAWERAVATGQTTKRLEEFLHAPEGGAYVKLLMKLQGFVLRGVRVVTTPSAYLKDELVRAYRVDPARAVVNYNAAEVSPAVEMPRRAHQVASVGRLVAWKGVDEVIRAVRELRTRIPDIELKIVGDGPEAERLKKLAQDIDAATYVTFLGSISHDAVLKVLAESAVSVLNSSYEGLPHVVLDSYATRTPVVATNIPGTREAVEHDTSGLLVPLGQTKELVAAIERCLDDQVLAQTLVRGGLTALEERFSWRRHLAVLEDIFNFKK